MPIRARPEVRGLPNEPAHILVDPCTDRTIDGDSTRVIENLIACQPSDIDPSYFRTVQEYCTPWMRHQVAQWLLEVCESEDCSPPCYPQAIQLFDRFLSKQSVPTTQLQLLAATCLFIASKVRESCAIPISSCVFYTDNSITSSQIREMELIVLLKLRWQVLSVTAYDFLRPIMHRIRLNADQIHRVRNRSRFLVDISCLEESLIAFAPSILASACIAISLKGIRLRGYRGHDLARFVSRRTQIDVGGLRECHEVLQNCIERWRNDEDQENTPQQVNQVWF